ncbi:MAG: arylsulfatase [Acidobacteria bacterium]|nr:arylsulfatase [Acidobacteriota bacterium]
MSESVQNRREFLKAVGGTAAAAGLGCAGGNEPQDRSGGAVRPNIIVIMADDFGISDLGCYGSEIETPNIDRLAAGGLRFTQFYNTARCCPTRASLLTGLYPHQAGVGHMMSDYGLPGYRGNLNRQCVTMAEALKPAGYKTLMSGKWHVTPIGSPQDNWPRQRGFDRFFGTIHGAGSFYDPVSLTLENEPIAAAAPDFYYTTEIGKYAARFIEEEGGRDDPFFLYMPFTASHWPLHAFEEDIAKYKGRYDGGWDRLRAERHERMIAMGIVDAKWKLTDRDANVPAWNDADHKAWQARRMEVYAAQIDVMDRAVGTVMNKVEQMGLAENTLVLFLADNGGCAEELHFDDRSRSPSVPPITRDGRPVQASNDPAVMPGPEDTYQSYGLPWANASNTPFRRYKHWVHEGGIATPLIAHWPGRIRDTGGLTNAPGHLIDIMATCVDVAGAEYPSTFSGNEITPLEGKSLVPVFERGEREGHEAIYWEHEGNRAIRRGDRKLVSRYGQPTGGAWELYDLAADRTETINLAESHPDEVAELSEMYEAWARRADVVPWKSWQRTG